MDGPPSLRTRWVPLGEVLGHLVGYRSSRAEAWGTHLLGSRTGKIWDLDVLGDVLLLFGPLDGTCVGNARFPTAAVDGLGKAPAAGGYTLSGRRLVDGLLGEALAES